MSLDKYDNFVENASASTVFSVLVTTGPVLPNITAVFLAQWRLILYSVIIKEFKIAHIKSSCNIFNSAESITGIMARPWTCAYYILAAVFLIVPSAFFMAFRMTL
jgi:hypothetical protein